MSNMRAQMGKLMETIQVVAKGQEAIARGQEEICQVNLRATSATLHNPTPADPAVQIPVGTPIGVGLVNPNIIPAINPPILEVNNQDDAFFIPRDESVFATFGPTSV